jgi:hypothetical protein
MLRNFLNFVDYHCCCILVFICKVHDKKPFEGASVQQEQEGINDNKNGECNKRRGGNNSFTYDIP